MPVTYQFLPWVRRGLARALTAVDQPGASLQARGLAKVGIRLADLPPDSVPPLDLQLHGPGDVIGIDASLVVRTEPRAHATNFEPNYFAAIDFDPPDFPWLLTPARADANGRLRPWLVLVVTETAVTGAPRLRPPALLPVLRVAAGDVSTQLPPLAESWSWAHAQVVSAATDPAGVRHDLQGNPASNVSRLLCPRKLKPRTAYVACLVPAFRPGVLRGLGLAGDGSGAAMQTLAPAWSDGADAALPVYYHWEFSTGEAGDFESLARRLRTPKSYAGDAALKAQLAQAGTAPMRVDDVINGAETGLRATMEGALVPISYPPGRPTPIAGDAAPYAEDVQAPQLAEIVNTPLDQVVNPVGDGLLNAAGRRLEVKPPLYGAWHAKDHSVEPAERAGHWLAELNLSPRYRGAAGHGAAVVRKFQEEYVDACWDQVGEVLAGSMKFNLTRLAIEVQGALKRRHFDPLPPARLLQVAAPALARIEALGDDGVAYRLNGKVGSLGGQLERTSLPAALAEPGMRRLLSPQRRALRLAARARDNAAALAALAQGYVGTMAAASTRPDAYAVNRFVPDGIVGTHFFDGVDLEGAPERKLDLRALGLGSALTVGDLRRQRQLDQAARSAASGFDREAIPQVRAGQKRGIFTDLHVERYAALTVAAAALKGSDWGLLATQVENQGARGVEGFLVESDSRDATLQVSAMRLDSRSGSLRLDRVLTRFDAQRAEQAAAVPRGPAGSVLIGKIQRTDAAKFSNPGLLGALPVNALSSSAGELTPAFRLGDDFDIVAPDAAPAGPVVSVTLPPAIRRRTILQRYTAATRGLQQQWVDAYDAQRVARSAVDFPLARAAAIVRARSDPELTLARRLDSLVRVGDQGLPGSGASLARHLGSAAAFEHLRYMLPALRDRVMAWPHLRDPLYAALAAVDKEAFMPGIGRLPQDLIMLVQVNQKFVDSFMVGANVEMNRELLWRGYPTDLRGTPFQRFWNHAADEMEPIHAWGVQRLGERVDANQPQMDRVALLVRGQLLRRYPNSAVYAWERDGQGLRKNPDGSPTQRRDPVFCGFIEPDITFYGFDIRKQDIGLWCFVLEQQMTEVRFGFDVEETPEGAPAGPGPKRNPLLRRALAEVRNPLSAEARRGFNPWRALSWSHLALGDAAHLSVLDHLVAMPLKPYGEFPTLSASATSGEVAKALLQEPFRGYYIGTDLAT